MCERLEHHRLFLLILAGYLSLGLAYSLVNPLFESPDEALNYANIRFMAEERRLPVLEPGEMTKAHHPPLYYALGALITSWVPNEHLDVMVERVNPFWAYRPWEPGVDNKSLYLHDPRLECFPYRDVALGVHLVRFLSLLMGAGTVICVYGTARELVGDRKGDRKGRPYVALGAAALVAFNPMFLFITASVHDDALANLVAAATLYATARLLVRGPTVRRASALGLLVGLCVLTKFTCLLVAPTVGFALTWRVLTGRGHDGWREAIRMGGIVLVLALLVGGWWFVRNTALYGEPTGLVREAEVWGTRENAPDLAAAVRELGFLHDSAWGVFGYGQISMPHMVYDLARLLDVVAVGGFALFWARRRSETGFFPENPVSVLFILASAPLVAFLVIFARMMTCAVANFGRYLFVTSVVLAPLYTLGLSEWVPARRRAWLTLALALGMLALAVYGLVGVLAPAYAPPPRYTSPDEVAPQHPVDATYPGLARLLGYDIAPDPLYPGDVLEVTLYWQVIGETEQDYVSFLQVFGRGGGKVGERDTHPGLGRYPTSRWQAGEVIADTVLVPLAADAPAPAALRLDLGFYPPGGPRLTAADGRDTVSVGPVRLAAREPTPPTGTPVDYHLGEEVRLVAWDPEWDGPVRPGETLRFTLYWACNAPPNQSLNVFVHLVGEEGPPPAQGDGPPLGGDYPTDLWAAGEMIADGRVVLLPDDLPSGRYALLVGLYSLQTGERLPAFDGQGTRLAADAVPLGVVEVGR
jgi:4-amino-4-deoxy-L-arabinose transferase-like glycosyltransferase